MSAFLRMSVDISLHFFPPFSPPADFVRRESSSLSSRFHCRRRPLFRGRLRHFRRSDAAATISIHHWFHWCHYFHFFDTSFRHFRHPSEFARFYFLSGLSFSMAAVRFIAIDIIDDSLLTDYIIFDSILILRFLIISAFLSLLHFFDIDYWYYLSFSLRLVFFVYIFFTPPFFSFLDWYWHFLLIDIDDASLFTSSSFDWFLLIPHLPILHDIFLASSRFYFFDDSFIARRRVCLCASFRAFSLRAAAVPASYFTVSLLFSLHFDTWFRQATRYFISVGHITDNIIRYFFRLLFHAFHYFRRFLLPCFLSFCFSCQLHDIFVPRQALHSFSHRMLPAGCNIFSFLSFLLPPAADI